MTETQTGFQRRQPERQIGERELRVSLGAIHVVGNREREELGVWTAGIVLDVGERHDVDRLETEVLSLLYRQGR